MATVIIHRSSEYTNRFRDIRILIDGKEQGRIANGQELSLKVAPGAHSLQAKIDWAGSRKFQVEVREGEEKHVHLAGFRYSRYIGYLFPAIIALGLIPSGVVDIRLQIGIFLVVLLYMIYYLTIGRHDYLTLKEWEETKPAA